MVNVCSGSLNHVRFVRDKKKNCIKCKPARAFAGPEDE